MGKSTWVLHREIDGFKAVAKATWSDETNTFDCVVGETLATARRCDNRETGCNPVDELVDMIECEIEDQKSREAFNAGPFSTALSSRL